MLDARCWLWLQESAATQSRINSTVHGTCIHSPYTVSGIAQKRVRNLKGVKMFLFVWCDGI